MTIAVAELQSQLLSDQPDVVDTDIAIIGSGMGGGTLAYALRDCGANVLIVEQGDFLPVERENWSFDAVHTHGRYKNSAAWCDATTGKDFVPGNYHYVGGSTKLYGATLPRFREFDFGEIEHIDGVSPAWPISYADLEPYYGAAEHIFWVHANKDEDPTDPWRSTDYPFPGLAHEGAMAKLVDAARRQGLHPFAAPQALDRRPGGSCVLCYTCDSFACMVDAKGDADVAAVRPALRAATKNVRLLTNAEVTRLNTDTTGRTVTAAQILHRGRRIQVRAKRFVVACGAVNTAALLLRSQSSTHPRGLANTSDQVGRNYMAHVTTFFLAINPRHLNEAVYQKTLGINDWYTAGPIALTRRVTNLAAHKDLIKRMKSVVRKAGFPIILTRNLGVEATSHQCGTARMGHDPATSVVDADLRAHDLDNMWIADSSPFPSSAAVNPALTVAALALRLAGSGALTA